MKPIALIILLLISGCGQKSEITTDIPPQKFAQKLQTIPFKSIQLSPLEVEPGVTIFSVLGIPILSDLADTIVNTMVSVVISFGLGAKVSTDDEADFIEVGDIKSSILRGLRLTRLTLRVTPKDRKWYEWLMVWKVLPEVFSDDLAFFDKIQIYFATEDMLERNPDLKVTLAVFSDVKNKPYECQDPEVKKKTICIDFEIPNVNILQYIEGPTNLYIIPEVDVDASPRAFTLGGEMDFELITDLGDL